MVVRILRKRQHLVFEGLDWLFFALTQKSTDKTWVCPCSFALFSFIWCCI